MLYASAERYIAAAAAAPEGGRNDALNRLAHGVAERFTLSDGEYESLLLAWARSCTPPMPEAEAVKTIRSAVGAARGRGTVGSKGTVEKAAARSGWSATRDPARPAAPPPAKREAPPPKPEPKTVAGVPLPDPLPDPTRAALRAAFRPGECVRIVPATLTEDGREIPDGDGYTLPLETWLEKLDKANGDVNRLFQSTSRTGIYVAVNPLSAGGTRDADVTAYRHALVEFDSIPKDQQWAIIQDAKLSITAAIDSGGKSVHAWVRVDARDRAEFDARVQLLIDHFAEYGMDVKNKNPSRLSRLPGCERFNGRQELLALALNPETTFAGWASAVGSGLPEIDDAADLIERVSTGAIAAPPTLIDGVLHTGHKLALGGGSKTNKTWCILDMALSIATGTPWWGRPCAAGRVLFINFEIDRNHFALRVNRVAQAKGIQVDPGALKCWTLRGHSAPYWELIPTIIAAMRGQQWAMVCIDPLYCMMGEADENKATDMARLLGHIDRLTTHTGAAVAFAAHFSKGNQSEKNSMDRISGSGVFARNPDSILTMTQHEVDDHFTVDFTLRNFAWVAPQVVRWDYPLMRSDKQTQALDASKLKRPAGGRQRRIENETILKGIPAAGGTIVEIRAALRASGNETSDRTIRERLADLEADLAVEQYEGPKGQKAYRLKPNEDDPGPF